MSNKTKDRQRERGVIQGGRITSLFGTLLPPKKKQKPDRYLTLRFKITGILPSKKNTLKAECNWRFIKSKAQDMDSAAEAVAYISENIKWFIRNSDEYEIWEKKAIEEILPQAEFWANKYREYGISYPIDNASMKIYHYWATDVTRDNTNKADTIQDMLKRINIISDDSWHNLNPVTLESEYYGGDIPDHITIVDLTVRITPNMMKDIS